MKKGQETVLLIIAVLLAGFIFGAIGTFFYNASQSYIPSEVVPEKVTELAMQTIDKGEQSGLQEEAEYVIKSNEEWEAFWNKHNQVSFSTREIPSIQFDQDMVIAAFFGVKGTSGYSISIDRIVETHQYIEVYGSKSEPNKTLNETLAQVGTNPYHIVSVPKSAKEVKFYFKQLPHQTDNISNK